MELRDLRAGGSDGRPGVGGGGGGVAGAAAGAAGGAGAPEFGGICIGGTGGGQRLPTKADLFIEQLNSTNAKKVALLLVLGFIVYHGLLNWNYGGYRLAPLPGAES